MAVKWRLIMKIRSKTSFKVIKKARRAKRTRAKIIGSAARPRLAVFRSNKHIYAQIIDDIKKTTIVAASDSELKDKKVKKSDIASNVGKILGEKAIDKKIKSVVFDKRGYKYHGRIKALAEGVREAGLKF